jgi:hypothetical protein
MGQKQKQRKEQKQKDRHRQPLLSIRAKAGVPKIIWTFHMHAIICLGGIVGAL